MQYESSSIRARSFIDLGNSNKSRCINTAQRIANGFKSDILIEALTRVDYIYYYHFVLKSYWKILT